MKTKYTIFTLLACFLLPFNLFAQKPIAAKVVGIISGDTISVETKDNRQMTFRIAGIDAPEEGQDFERNARQSLSFLVFNQNVTVSNFKNDCLNRPIASVMLKDKDLSLWAIESGYAWADSSCQANEALVKKELSAREGKVGLWRNPNAVRPSEFLKGIKEQPQTKGEPERKIFGGLAPTPPPILTPEGKPTGLYIGMTIDDFIRICGEVGEQSKTMTNEYGQSFSVEIAATKDNSGKGCFGSFGFNRTKSKPIFKLDSVYQ